MPIGRFPNFHTTDDPNEGLAEHMDPESVRREAPGWEPLDHAPREAPEPQEDRDHPGHAPGEGDPADHPGHEAPGPPDVDHAPADQPEPFAVEHREADQPGPFEAEGREADQPGPFTGAEPVAHETPDAPGLPDADIPPAPEWDHPEQEFSNSPSPYDVTFGPEDEPPQPPPIDPQDAEAQTPGRPEIDAPEQAGAQGSAFPPWFYVPAPPAQAPVDHEDGDAPGGPPAAEGLSSETPDPVEVLSKQEEHDAPPGLPDPEAPPAGSPEPLGGQEFPPSESPPLAPLNYERNEGLFDRIAPPLGPPTYVRTFWYM